MKFFNLENSFVNKIHITTEKKMRIRQITAILLVFIIIFACEDQITSECDDEEVEYIMPAQFSAIQDVIFNERCITCHSGSAPTGNLNLSSATSYLQLMSKNLIVPGNSSLSTLYQKLNSTNPNSVMPPTGKIEQGLIDSVAAWIDKGAPNN